MGAVDALQGGQWDGTERSPVELGTKVVEATRRALGSQVGTSQHRGQQDHLQVPRQAEWQGRGSTAPGKDTGTVGGCIHTCEPA